LGLQALGGDLEAGAGEGGFLDGHAELAHLDQKGLEELRVGGGLLGQGREGET
jgi:hypothetical protein